MSLNTRSLALTLQEAERAFKELKRVQKKPVKPTPKKAANLTAKYPLVVNNPLLWRIRQGAQQAMRPGGMESDLAKMEVEKSILFELAAQSVGSSPMSHEAARELFRRDRSSSALMLTVDPRLKKKAVEVIKIAQVEARKEQAEETSRPISSIAR